MQVVIQVDKKNLKKLAQVTSKPVKITRGEFLPNRRQDRVLRLSIEELGYKMTDEVTRLDDKYQAMIRPKS